MSKSTLFSKTLSKSTCPNQHKNQQKNQQSPVDLDADFSTSVQQNEKTQFPVKLSKIPVIWLAGLYNDVPSLCCPPFSSQHNLPYIAEGIPHEIL